MADPYLVGLDLAGRRVVVVGGGAVAQRRLVGLLAAGADVEVIAPALTPAVEGMAGAGELCWTARVFRPGDLAGAWYALAATDVAGVNAEVAAEADRTRTFCVRADDAPSGSAVTPAVGTHDGLTVGVLAGRRPRRSAAVRTALVEALASGLVDDSAEPVTPGVALVGGGPGDPELIGVPVSHRGVAHEIVVVSGEAAPDDPGCLVDWAALGRLRGTVVLLVAVERIGMFAAALIGGGRAPDTPVSVVQDATRSRRSVFATLATVADVVAEHGIDPPAVVVVGAVAGLSGPGPFSPVGPITRPAAAGRT